MEDAGVIKLYEPSPTPCLYVAMAENMVGRVPLIPLFLEGNSTPSCRQRSLTCSASARIRAFRTVALTLLLQTEGGAAMFMRSTVNPWLWQFGRGKPRLGDLETTDRKKGLESCML
jgi:hypothetical protein